jgi:LDH2 family malate/lactate/ureidoglycolate dehydrogenase
MTTDALFSAEPLRAFVEQLVVKMGTPGDIASEVARHLVRANLSGYDSHGVMRLAQYAGQIDEGKLVPAGRPCFVHQSTTTAVIDSQRGFGHFASRFAVDCVARKAKEHGLAAAAIRHATHVGRVGEFTERCREFGLVLLMTVGMAGPGVGGVVAQGGRERFFGANVWSIGVPGLTTSMVFDGSMASTAVGNVYVAKARGHQLPKGSIIDRNGEPSTDPEAYYAGGAVLPMGGDQSGHKGYGLALASALLSGLAMIDDHSPTLAGATVREGADPVGRMAGVFVLAIDPNVFGGTEPYQRLVDDCLTAAKNVAPIPGSDAVSVPGERASRMRERRRQDGIPIPQATCNELTALAGRFGVRMPAPCS